MAEEEKLSGRGFASLPKKRRIEIARQGGIAARDKGTAHRWNSQTGREAGRKGGSVMRSRRETGYQTNSTHPGRR